MSIALVDIVALVLIGFTSSIGLFNGFVRELFSTLAWFVSLFISWTYSSRIYPYMEVFELSIELLPYASFALVFIVLFILLILIGKVIASLVMFFGLGIFDRVLGVFFGFLKSLVILITIILFTNEFLAEKDWWEETMTKRYTSILIEKIGPFLNSLDQDNINFLKKENVPI